MRLTEDHIDALTEIVNIGVGRSAASLSELTDRHIALRVPAITPWTPQGDADDAHKSLNTSVTQDFSGSLEGRALLSFPSASGVALARLLSGEEDGEPDELEMDLAGILEEVGNIVLNGVLGSLSNVIEGNLDYTVPRLTTDRLAQDVLAEHRTTDGLTGQTILVADTHFEVSESEIGGSLLLVFDMRQMESLLDNLLAEAEA